MTKKHFEMIAAKFRHEVAFIKAFPGKSDRNDAALDHLENLARHLCEGFKAENQRFDSERFLAACGF